MAYHAIYIFPVHLIPFPAPRTSTKHELLPGLWLESINSEFARIAHKQPPDSTVRTMRDALVLDFPVYVRGLLKRLQGEGLDSGLSHEDLSSQNDDRPYLDHPLEIHVQEKDIRKLAMMSFISGGRV